MSTHDFRDAHGDKMLHSSARLRHGGVSAAAAPQHAVYAEHDVLDPLTGGVTLNYNPLQNFTVLYGTGTVRLNSLYWLARHEGPVLCGHLHVPERSKSGEEPGIPAVDKIKSTLPTLVLRTAPFMGDNRSRVSETELSRKNTRFVKIPCEASVELHLIFLSERCSLASKSVHFRSSSHRFEISTLT